MNVSELALDQGAAVGIQEEKRDCKPAIAM